MNKLKIAFLLLLSICSFLACEKDDICVDGNTPLLVIRFYDKDNPEEVKPVTTLQVRGVNEGESLAILPIASLDSIAIPLRPNMANTTFSFSENQTPTDESLAIVNTVTFSYETQEIFKSRACGFVANYDSLNVSNVNTGDEAWISEIQIVNPLIENATAAHVKILH